MEYACKRCALDPIQDLEPALVLIDINYPITKRWDNNMLELKCPRCGNKRPKYTTKVVDGKVEVKDELWVPAYLPGVKEELEEDLPRWKPKRTIHPRSLISSNNWHPTEVLSELEEKELKAQVEYKRGKQRRAERLTARRMIRRKHRGQRKSSES